VTALALALLLSAADAPPAAVRAPRIAVEPAAFDFGPLRPRHRVQRQFLVKNFGSADLTVANVSTTCGCMAALLDRKTIKPGRSAMLRVTFDTRDDVGKVVRSVLLESNDPVHPKLELKLEATVMPGTN
jgi:uncharacterized protein DUF1573